MGLNISFETGSLDFPDGSIVVYTENEEMYWDNIMIGVCKELTVHCMLRSGEHTSATRQAIRFVIEYMLKIDVSKWSDERVGDFLGFLLFIDHAEEFTREYVQSILDKRTEYHKYLA